MAGAFQISHSRIKSPSQCRSFSFIFEASNKFLGFLQPLQTLGIGAFKKDTQMFVNRNLFKINL